MPLKEFICPDHAHILVGDCLKEGGCRMGDRCATRSYLQFVAKERPWTGKPSCTQLIQGTMCAFLKLTKDYAIYPDSRAFAVHGTKAHANLETATDECSELEVKFADSNISGIADNFETENGRTILIDYKTSGSFKVAKALGFYVDKEPTGEIYKSGKNKGEPKMRSVLKRDPAKEDRWEWNLQLNFYRIQYEKMTGRKVSELRIQCIARDGNTYIARGRGIFRNVYYFKIELMPDAEVLEYFSRKRWNLFQALKQGYWKDPCESKENWEGVKCGEYCEVAEHCPLGKYLKKNLKEVEEMSIKGLTEIRRFPRLGKIRLGIKKTSTRTGKEYPAEVDYFVLDPSTAVESEGARMQQEFERLYGKEPKRILIMLPMDNTEVIFPQWYKRYGSSTMLKCRGDNETAVCSKPEYAAGLQKIGEDEFGLIKVKCLGEECPYVNCAKPECGRSATLQVLLPEMPGAGVWQITTGSFHSIVNLNSCFAHIRAIAGRFHMLPLYLERRPQDIVNPADGKKQTHYILHIDMSFTLAELQRYAQIDTSKIMIELAPVEDEKEDIYFERNKNISMIKDESATSAVAQKTAAPGNGKSGPIDLGDHPDKEKAAFNAAETAGKIISDDEQYGKIDRFIESERVPAGNLITKIKEYREKIGDAKFLYCLGQEGGAEKVADITKVKILTSLLNALIVEWNSMK